MAENVRGSWVSVEDDVANIELISRDTLVMSSTLAVDCVNVTSATVVNSTASLIVESGFFGSIVVKDVKGS